MDFPHVENYYVIPQWILCIRKIPQMDFPHVENYYVISQWILCIRKTAQWIFHMWKIIIEFHFCVDFMHKENSTNGFSARGKLLCNSTMDFRHVENYYGIP